MKQEWSCSATEIGQWRNPLTQGALLQHLRRAKYQAGVWTTSELTKQKMVGVGVGMMKYYHGLLSGQHYLLLAKHVQNL